MASNDPELKRVSRAILGSDASATAAQIGDVFRASFDQILDGVHTGRFDWPQLYKTEKTHFGTLVEINLRRAFPHFGDGQVMDYEIEGVEVDCKYSQKMFGWMIPGEAVGHVCIVATAEDRAARWSMGVVRITQERLRESVNQDKKSQLNEAGRAAIQWLYRDAPLSPNVYLQLAPEKVANILDPAISGQQRVVRLFTHATGRIVGRGAVATAAQQDDFMKRVRYNGGARDLLRPHGIVIFGHEHQDLALRLKLPVPSKGEFVSARLAHVPANSRRSNIMLERDHWAVALPDEPTQNAPMLPRALSVR